MGNTHADYDRKASSFLERRPMDLLTCLSFRALGKEEEKVQLTTKQTSPLSTRSFIIFVVVVRPSGLIVIASIGWRSDWPTCSILSIQHSTRDSSRFDRFSKKALTTLNTNVCNVDLHMIYTYQLHGANQLSLIVTLHLMIASIRTLSELNREWSKGRLSMGRRQVQLDYVFLGRINLILPGHVPFLRPYRSRDHAEIIGVCGEG